VDRACMLCMPIFHHAYRCARNVTLETLADNSFAVNMAVSHPGWRTGLSASSYCCRTRRSGTIEIVLLALARHLGTVACLPVSISITDAFPDFTVNASIVEHTAFGWYVRIAQLSRCCSWFHCMFLVMCFRLSKRCL